MPFTIGGMRFCRVEECLNRTYSGACARSGIWAGRSSSELFVAKCRQDATGVAALRSILPQFGVGVASHISTTATLKVFAEHFSSGRLRMCQTSFSTTALTGDPATANATVSAPPVSEKPFPLANRLSNPQSTSTLMETQSSFPADVHLAALAQALKAATQAGVPFCEECQRGAGAQANA